MKDLGIQWIPFRANKTEDLAGAMGLALFMNFFLLSTLLPGKRFQWLQSGRIYTVCLYSVNHIDLWALYTQTNSINSHANPN